MAEKQYKVIIQGENGRGNQVFESDTPEEMKEQFQNAQYHATRKISEMGQENAQLRQQLAQRGNGNGNGVENGNGGGFDKAKYHELLFSDPLAAQEYALAYNQTAQTVVQTTTAAIHNQIVGQFAAQHPEVMSLSQEKQIEIGNTLKEMMVAKDMPLSLDSLNDAYTIACATRKISVPNAQVGGEEIEIMQPLPTTVTRPSAQINTTESEEHFLRTAKTEDVRTYLEKKHSGSFPR